MTFWAESFAAGVPEPMYWRSTPREVYALTEALNERRTQQEHAANLRAGLVAAAVYNVNMRRGAKPLGPGDFFETPKAEREQTWGDVERIMQTIIRRQEQEKARARGDDR